MLLANYGQPIYVDDAPDLITEAAALVDRLETGMCDLTEMGERRRQRVLDRATARLQRREFAELDAGQCTGFGCVDTCTDCAPPTHTPFSLAFEQSERELGEKIGYPALVYDASPAPRERPIANYGAARFDVIDQGKRRAVFDSYADAVLFCDAAGL